MTYRNKVETYRATGVMDRQDATDLSAHLMALASVLAAKGGIDASADHETQLHRARLVRIVQRATQPDVVAQVTVSGVDSLTYTIENGRRSMTVRTPRADIVLDLDKRTVVVDDRGARSDRVVPITPYLKRA
jgi:hypothetical protein